VDIDRLDRLLEHRAWVLDSAAGLLQGVIRLGRGFTASEEDSWTWAMSHADDLAAQSRELAESLRRRRYDLRAPRRAAQYSRRP